MKENFTSQPLRGTENTRSPPLLAASALCNLTMMMMILMMTMMMTTTLIMEIMVMVMMSMMMIRSQPLLAALALCNSKPSEGLQCWPGRELWRRGSWWRWSCWQGSWWRGRRWWWTLKIHTIPYMQADLGSYRRSKAACKTSAWIALAWNKWLWKKYT